MDREASIVFAKKYLEDLLSFFGLNTEVYATADEEVIELHVPSTHLNGFLIGQRGETLRSLQFMIATTLKNNEAVLNRVNVDIADYKRHRYDRLAEQVREWIEAVRSSGEPKHLDPMNAAERRIVHKTVGEYSDVATHSEGEGRDRHVVLTRAEEAA
ncbi:single-stranded DNA-binding protein [Candidatus Saccharibacteria bacterium]|nr:single-stranded DNA-binding protein [Candidatus Saccharibacteria bacterium]